MTLGNPPLRVAIMQPYFFPHLGCFQLIAAADEFRLFDYTRFIQRGWMHRDRLRINQDERRDTFTVNKSPRKDIINDKTFGNYACGALNKLSSNMANGYKDAPHLTAETELIAATASRVEPSVGLTSFTDITYFALERVCAAFKLDLLINGTFSLSMAANQAGQSRIIAACQAIGATSYVNMMRGEYLNDAEAFVTASISLVFMTPILPTYNQGACIFLAGLSILDTVTNIPVDCISPMLNPPELIVARHAH